MVFRPTEKIFSFSMYPTAVGVLQPVVQYPDADGMSVTLGDLLIPISDTFVDSVNVVAGAVFPGNSKVSCGQSKVSHDLNSLYNSLTALPL